MLAEIVVIASSLFMIGFGVITLVRPSATEHFIGSFASSRKAHLTEMFFRLLFGAALIWATTDRLQPSPFTLLGGVIVASTLVLIALPWRVHQRFGARVLPLITRHLRLYGLGALTFGVLVLYGLYAQDVYSAAVR